MATDSTNQTGADTAAEPTGPLTLIKGDAAQQVPDQTDGIRSDGTGEMQEIVLKVGPGGRRSQRFVGKLLDESREYTGTGINAVRVYESRKGKYVVHRHRASWPDFTAGNDWSSWKKACRDLLGVVGFGEQSVGDFTVDIVDAPAQLQGLLPERMYRIVLDIIENPAQQNLEI